jgi:hypothetical protein
MDTLELRVRQISKTDASEDYISWALEMMATGHNSESLSILAGLDLEKPILRDDVEKYFKKVMIELDFILHPDTNVLRWYSELLAWQILNDIVSPVDALRKLSSLYVVSGYSENIFLSWYVLDDDYDTYTSSGHTYTFEVSKEGIGQTIRDEALQFLRTLKEQYPEDFTVTEYCKKCQQSVEVEKCIGVRDRILMFGKQKTPGADIACTKCNYSKTIPESKRVDFTASSKDK